MSTSISEYGPGWQSIVDSFEEFNEWNTTANDVDPVNIWYIKEKFGELRINYSGGDKTTDAASYLATRMSRKICEECGAPASSRSRNGWVKTLCEEHV